MALTETQQDAPSGRPTPIAKTGTGPTRIAIRVASSIVAWVILGAGLIAVLLPLAWMVLSGFKTNAEMFSNVWGLPQEWLWENYTLALNQGVLTFAINSLIVTAASIIGVVLIASWASYALTRLSLPYAETLTMVILGGMMLAPAVALVPLFSLLQTLNLYDTRVALILLYVAYRIPFTLFLIRAYMLTLPRDVEEAAKVDGATHWQTFIHVVLPLTKPILISAGIVQALFAWNEFPFALVFISDSALKTLPVGLLELRSAVTTNWPVLFAGLTLAALPMMIGFFVSQKRFIRGLAEGVGK